MTGFAKLGLGLDASNKTGSVQVYESLGLRAERAHKTQRGALRALGLLAVAQVTALP